jgi:hypothetical protein
MLWRHGDVLIAKIDSLPADMKRREDGVLAYGEITGHAHRLQVPESAELWELDGVLYMKVVAPVATVVHEEHKPIMIPEGLYRVWQQREYTPDSVRIVVD